MSRQAEAAQILSEVVRDLSSPGRDIKLALRKCLHAYQVIGFDEGAAWVRHEPEGYPLELGLPAYRSVPGVLEWRMAAMPTQPSDDFFARVLDLSETEPTGIRLNDP